MSTFSYKSGRVWIQTRKFDPFRLFLLSGLTNVSDPVGSPKIVREPSAKTRRKSVISDILRGEADLPGFNIETRFAQSRNYMMGLKNCRINVQAHMGACGRADNYYTSEAGFLWNQAIRGDMGIDRLAMIEGEDSTVEVAVPFAAVYGPTLVDFKTEFLSARTISEAQRITDIFFLDEECLEDCMSQEDIGENGYLATGVTVDSPLGVSDLWYTEDRGDNWAQVSAMPFGAGVTISCVTAIGEKMDHRVIVSRGTTDALNPAGIAYADVDEFGTTVWNYVDVGAVDGQYINYMYLESFGNVFAVTDDGYVYRSTDGGASWTAVVTDATEELWDVVANHEGVVWVVGDACTILMSEDFGESWTEIDQPDDWTTEDILTVTMCPDGTVIVGNDAGEVAGSYDNGASWTELPIGGITPSQINRVRAYDNDVIWLIALKIDVAHPTRSYVFRSTDGGASFRLWNLNLPDNGGLTSLFVVDANIVHVGGEPYDGVAFLSRTKTKITGLPLAS